MPTTTNNLTARPPIVVVMGHIDHGKSTLLDYIRQSNIVAGEAGGITQHLGAYEIVYNNHKITFLDTPGHEAFSAMRERGGSAADIAILVVSAEDGVKAQTKEALNTITTLNLPYIVAINKIDKPNANVEIIKQQLAENNVLLESYGGKVPSAEISAKTGQGVNDLLDLVLLLAELQELTADPKAPAGGVVLETNLDPRAGVSATLLIKNGTLHLGDLVVSGKEVAKIRKISDQNGKQVSESSFSTPVEVSGFSSLPAVSAAFQAFPSKTAAKDFLTQPQSGSVGSKPVGNKQAPSTNENIATVSVIIKTDVAGSLEAVKKEVTKLAKDNIIIRFIAEGVGAVTENDIKAATADTLVLGFNVKVDKNATTLAEKLKITIQTFDIIYRLSEWLEKELENRRPVSLVEEVVGKAKILRVFSKDKDRQVIGGSVLEGKLTVGNGVKISRRGSEIGQGKIVELQSQKLKVKEIEKGSQFGTMVESKVIIAAEDVLEAFEQTKKIV
jgi:translation initiation factor IF-2